METIQLAVTSPRVTLAGIDAAIEKLTQISALETRLREHSETPIRIRFMTEGAEGIERAAGKVQDLNAGIRVMAEALRGFDGGSLASLGDKLEKGMVSSEQAVSKVSARLKALREEVRASDSAVIGKQADWQSLDSNPNAMNNPQFLDKLAAHRREMDEAIAQNEAMKAQLVELSRLEGGLTALQGQHGGSGATGAAKAEEKLAGASKQSGEALAAQDEIVKRKMISLGLMEERVTKLAAAEDELAEAADRAAGARYEGPGVISERTRNTEEGENVTQKVQDSDGKTRTYNAGRETGTDTSFIEQYENKLTAIRAQSFEDQKKTLSGTAEHIELLRQEAASTRAVADEMKAQGLGEHELAGQANLRATALENSAAQKEQRNGVRESARDEQARHATLMQNAREYRAEIERTSYADKRGGVEAMQVLDERTHKLAVLAAEMRAQGMGNTPAGASMIRGLETAQQKAMADSAAIGNQMREQMAEVKRISDAFHAEAAKYPANPKRTQTTETAEGSTRVTTYQKEAAGLRELIRLREEYDSKGALTGAKQDSISQQVEPGRNNRGLINPGANFVRNLATVTQWTAATTALYGSFELLKKGATVIVEVETQTAHLQAVFRGTRADTLALRDSMLELAVANGRSGTEAMEAAIHWARLGLTAQETAAAVDVSLKAANLSDMTSEEAVSQLTALYSTYHLEVGDLAGVLGELNSISNNYNATQKEMFDGLARTSGMAKEAGLSLSELIGLIGSGVGRTGRSGTEIGNAIKKLMVAENNPAMQQELHTQFKIDVITSGGDIKNESVLLRELYERYQALDEVERRALVTRLGGARAGGQIQAVLDGYINAQVLAIRAQENLNSAEREAGFIRETTLSQIKSMGTEMERLAVALGDLGVNDVFRNFAKDTGAWADMLERASHFLGRGTKLHASPEEEESTRGLWEPKPAMNAPSAPSIPELNNNEAGLIAAKGRAEAMIESETLARTMGHTIKAVGDRDPEEAKQQIRNFAGGVYDTATEVDAASKRLQGMVDAKDYASIDLELAKRAAYYRDLGAKAQADLNKATATTIANEKATLAALDKQIESRHNRSLDAGQQLKDRDEVQSRLLAHMGSASLAIKTDAMSDETAAEWEGANPGGASYFDEAGMQGERIKARLEGMASLQEKITEGSGRDVELLDRKKELIEQQQSALNDQLAPQDQSNEALQQEIEKRRTALGLQLAGIEAERVYAQIRDAAWRANELVGKRMEGMEAAGKAMPDVTGTEEEKLDRRQALNAEELRMLDEKIAAVGDTNSLLSGELETRRRTLLLQQEGIALEREFAAVQDAAFLGKKQGERDTYQYRHGWNETEKLINEARGIGGDSYGAYGAATRVPGELDRARDRLAYDNDPRTQFRDYLNRQQSGPVTEFKAIGAEQKAHDEAEALELGNRLYSIRESMLDRQAKLSAEIVDARRKENEEASKGLELASRKDQLTAALLEKYARQHGRLTDDQFQYLDKSTREVSEKLAPDSAPASLRTPLHELEVEKGLMDRSIGQITDRITAAIASLKPGSASVGAPPQITAPPITFTFGDEFRQLGVVVGNMVEAGLKVQIGKMNSELAGLLARNNLQGSQNAVVGGAL